MYRRLTEENSFFTNFHYVEEIRKSLRTRNVWIDYSYDHSKLRDGFTPFFRLWKAITKSPGKKIKTLRQYFVARNMMNKCAKFHKDSPSDKKVKFNLPSAIELSKTAVLHKKPNASEQLRWPIWPTLPLNFLMNFSQKMPLYCFYTMVPKSQEWPKTQIKGSCRCNLQDCFKSFMNRLSSGSYLNTPTARWSDHLGDVKLSVTATSFESGSLPVWSSTNRGKCFLSCTCVTSRASYKKSEWGLNPYPFGIWDLRHTYPLSRKAGEYLSSPRAD